MLKITNSPKPEEPTYPYFARTKGNLTSELYYMVDKELGFLLGKETDSTYKNESNLVKVIGDLTINIS